MNKKTFYTISCSLLLVLSTLFVNTGLSASYNSYKEISAKAITSDPEFKAYTSCVSYSNQLDRDLRSLPITSADVDRDQSSNVLIVFFKNEKLKQFGSQDQFAPCLPNPLGYNLGEQQGLSTLITLLENLNAEESSGFRSDFDHSLNHTMLLQNPEFLFIKQLHVKGDRHNSIHLHQRRPEHPMQVADYTFEFYNADESQTFTTLPSALKNVFAAREEISEIYLELAAPCFVTDGCNSNFGLFELGLTVKNQYGQPNMYLSHRCFRRDNPFVFEDTTKRGTQTNTHGSALCSGFKVVCIDTASADKKFATLVSNIVHDDAPGYECISHTNYVQKINALKDEDADRKDFVSKIFAQSKKTSTILKESQDLKDSITQLFKRYLPSSENDIEQFFQDGIVQTLEWDKVASLTPLINQLLEKTKAMSVLIEKLGDLINDLTDKEIACIILTPSKRNPENIQTQTAFIKGLRDRHDCMKDFCSDINKTFIEPNFPDNTTFLSHIVTADTILEAQKRNAVQQCGKYLLQEIQQAVTLAVRNCKDINLAAWLVESKSINDMISLYRDLVNNVNRKAKAQVYLVHFSSALLSGLVEIYPACSSAWTELCQWSNFDRAKKDILIKRLGQDQQKVNNKVTKGQESLEVNNIQLMQLHDESQKSNAFFQDCAGECFGIRLTIGKLEDHIVFIKKETVAQESKLAQTKENLNTFITSRDKSYKEVRKIKTKRTEMPEKIAVVEKKIANTKAAFCELYKKVAETDYPEKEPRELKADFCNKVQTSGTDQEKRVLKNLQYFISVYTEQKTELKLLKTQNERYQTAESMYKLICEVTQNSEQEEKAIRSRLSQLQNSLVETQKSLAIMNKDLVTMNLQCSSVQEENELINNHLAECKNQHCKLSQTVSNLESIVAAYDMILKFESENK